MFEVQDLTKRFNGNLALDHCTFAVPRNTITGLIGPNGAGKTTLFDVVTGLVSPDAGSVYLDGRNITKLPAHTVARLGVARTFQLLRLYRDLTVLDNLLVARWRPAVPLLAEALLWPGRLASEEDRLRAECHGLLQRVKLETQLGSVAGNLSYGQQKVVEIVRAMSACPVLLLLDEPAAGLDTSMKRVVADLIRHLKKQGKTVILVEHDLGFVLELCEQVVVLDRGSVIFTGNPEDVRLDPHVRERYLSRPTHP